MKKKQPKRIVKTLSVGEHSVAKLTVVPKQYSEVSIYSHRGFSVDLALEGSSYGDELNQRTLKDVYALISLLEEFVASVEEHS